MHLNPSGARPALTEAEESFLVDCLLNFADQDLALTFDLARKLIIGLWPGRIQYNGKHFLAGDKGLRNFVRRHSDELAYGPSIPLNHLSRVTPEMIQELEQCYREFNELVARFRLEDDAIHAMDETKLSASAADSSHAKVIFRRGTKPYRRVHTLSTKASLVPLISASGDAAPPVVLHSQKKNTPRTQRDAWNEHSHQPDTLHIAAGTSATITGFLFNQCFEFWLPHLSLDHAHIILIDGYSAHYNPTTLLKMAHRGSSDPERHLLDGVGRAFAVIYPPSLTRFIAPPDHHTVFGAFERSRRSMLTRSSGAANLEQLMKTGGKAYAKVFKPANIREAFQACGFSTGGERFEAQAAIIASLRKKVEARAWTDEVGKQYKVILALAHPPAMGADEQAAHRSYLGEGAKTIGVVNDDDNIDALVAELERIKSGLKPKRKARRQPQEGIRQNATP